MKKLVPIFLLITVLFLIGSEYEASAKIKSSTAEVGFFGGGIVLNNSTGIDDKNLAGIDFTIHHTEKFALNFSFLNQLSNYDEIPSFNFYTASGMYKFTPRFRFSPYILFGLGAGTLIPDPDTNRIHFVLTWGGGAKYFIMKRVALKAEIRDYMTTNEFGHNIAGTVGIMYVFDLLAPFGSSMESTEPWQTTIKKEDKIQTEETIEEDQSSEEDGEETEDKGYSEETAPEQEKVPEKLDEQIEEDIEELSVEPIQKSTIEEQKTPDNLPISGEETGGVSEPSPQDQNETNDQPPAESGFQYIER